MSTVASSAANASAALQASTAATNASCIEARIRALEVQLGLTNAASFEKSDSNNASRDLSSRLEAVERHYLTIIPKSLRDAWQESDQLLDILDPGTALTHQTAASAAPILYRKQEVLATADQLKEDFDYVSQILNLLLIGQQQSLAGSSSFSATAPPLTTQPSGQQHGPARSRSSSSKDQFMTSPGTTAATSRRTSFGGDAAKGAQASAAAASGSTTSTLVSDASLATTVISEQQVVGAPILFLHPAETVEDHEGRMIQLERTLQDIQLRTEACMAQLDGMLDAAAELTTAVSEKLVLIDEDLCLLAKTQKSSV